jgi:hypothetical protein
VGGSSASPSRLRVKPGNLRSEARQRSGGPCPYDARRRPVGPRTDTGEIEARLAGLEALTIRDLRREWLNIYQAEPPSRLSRDLLVCAIAHDIQQRVHGGLRPATQRRLRALAEPPAGKADPGFAAGGALKPGARLVREWHGRVHTVAVLDHGFDYEGEIHRSLTQSPGALPAPTGWARSSSACEPEHGRCGSVRVLKELHPRYPDPAYRGAQQCSRNRSTAARVAVVLSEPASLPANTPATQDEPILTLCVPAWLRRAGKEIRMVVAGTDPLPRRRIQTLR